MTMAADYKWQHSASVPSAEWRPGRESPCELRKSGRWPGARQATSAHRLNVELRWGTRDYHRTSVGVRPCGELRQNSVEMVNAARSVCTMH